MINNIDYVLVFTVSRFQAFVSTGGLYPVQLYISYFNTSCSRYVRYPLLYVYQTLGKYFLLLSVLIVIIILHVSNELFR